MASSDYIQPNVQVPGLSLSPEEEENRRKNYIRDSDSEYVKLAKQGGIKDLLTIEADCNSHKEAVAYPKSDWFGHHSIDDDGQHKMSEERKWQAPDYMTHVMTDGEKLRVKTTSPTPEKVAAPIPAEEKPRQLTAREERMLIQAKYNTREVPYQTDNLSCWERKEEPPLRSRLHK